MQYKVFCANDQKVTTHEHLPDRNGEVLLQCTKCGRFLKFPAGIGQEEFAVMLRSLTKVNQTKKIKDVPQLSPESVSPETLTVKLKKWWENIINGN